MSASTIIGLGAVDAYDLLIEIAEQLAVFQARSIASINPHDEQVPGAYADVTRTLPDGTTSTATPCYLANKDDDAGEQFAADGTIVVNRYVLYVAYAPDVLIDYRVRQVRHAATGEVFAANPLYVTKIDHIAPVLSLFTLGEAR